MNHFSRLFLAATLVIVSVMFASAHAAGNENKLKPAPAVSREQAIESSAKANEKQTPAKEATGAAKDETHTPDVTDAAATAAAPAVVGTPADYDEATAYDESKVIGHAHPWQTFFQPSSSIVMQKIVGLHNMVTAIAILITLFVLGLLVYVCTRFSEKRNPVPATFAHNTKVEIAWTVIPILILIAIGIPSIRAHYQYTNNQDIIDHPDVTLKVVGHQWYWSYEYPDQGVAYDSNIVQAKDLKGDEPRLLTVDNPLVVPVGKVIRVQLTAADVIHAFSLPAMGVKQDAVPGRLNETWFKADKEGIYYGQCSELCGKFHGFMPIELHVVSEDEFERWASAAKQKFQ